MQQPLKARFWHIQQAGGDGPEALILGEVARHRPVLRPGPQSQSPLRPIRRKATSLEVLQTRPHLIVLSLEAESEPVVFVPLKTGLILSNPI